MRIYISGQITGLPKEMAERRFREAETLLADYGLDPLNPMTGEIPGRTWAEYMTKDFIMLDGCDAVYMLENWRESKGARIEHAIAEILGKAIFYEHSRLPVVLKAA